MGTTLLLESNFLLEIAFRQKQHVACQQLLAAARAGRVQLRLPAFCLMEAIYTLDGRSKDRKNLNRNLTSELTQFSREESEYNTVPRIISALNTLLITRSATQQEQLIALVDEMVSIGAQLIPLNADVWQQLPTVLATTDLKLGDALVYASIFQNLLSEPPTDSAVFLTRDMDFKEVGISERLRELNCDILFDFNAAIARLGLQNESLG